MRADWTEEPHAIAPLLAPRSVAIVGASSDPGRIGGRPVHYYRQAGFAGAVYPINPTVTRSKGTGRTRRLTVYRAPSTSP